MEKEKAGVEVRTPGRCSRTRHTTEERVMMGCRTRDGWNDGDLDNN